MAYREKVAAANITNAPGADTEVLFNDGGALGADEGMTYSKGGNTLTVGALIPTGITDDRAVIKTSMGLQNSSTTAAELAYVNGVTSAIQTQLNALNSQGADVASANDFTLSAGNSCEVTGNTQINAITTTGLSNGKLYTLFFASNPIIKHNTAGGAGTAIILLDGASDFAASAGDSLTLRLSEIGGAQAWREIGRAAI